MTASSRTRLTRMAAAGLLVALAHGAAGCAQAADRAPANLTSAQKAAVAVAERTLASSGARAAANFTLRSVEPRQWSDSSLGCPQRGMNYLQVIMDGYLVKLESQGEVHEVHVAGESAVVCPALATGTARVPGPMPRVANLDVMEKNAVADLAQRLKVEASGIRVTGRIPQRWEDASLGCGSPAETSHTGGAVAGFKLVLRHQDRAYTYHTDLKRVMPCPPIESD